MRMWSNVLPQAGQRRRHSFRLEVFFFSKRWTCNLSGYKGHHVLAFWCAQPDNFNSSPRMSCPVLSSPVNPLTHLLSRLMIPIIKIFLRRTSLGKIIPKKWWWQKLTNQRNLTHPRAFSRKCLLAHPPPKSFYDVILVQQEKDLTENIPRQMDS